MGHGIPFILRLSAPRYGPYPLSHCGPCVHLSDFAIFALAPTVLPYLRTLILTSFITTRPAQRPAWRTPALVVLAAAFFAEVWWTVDGQVQFRDGRLDGWVSVRHCSRFFSFCFLAFLIRYIYLARSTSYSRRHAHTHRPTPTPTSPAPPSSFSYPSSSTTSPHSPPSLLFPPLSPFLRFHVTLSLTNPLTSILQTRITYHARHSAPLLPLHPE